VMPSLLDLPGVGSIVAGIVLAEAGDPSRFASPHHSASYCEAVPVERGNGQNRRMQINPGLPSGKDNLTFDFKWTDKIQHPDDVMDLYLSGDLAPDDRFRYRYTTK
jgi:hypothetical protein